MSVLEVKIYYEDTDCGGVVYHANYLKYFERARTEYLAECGFSVLEYMNQGIQFAVVRAEVIYNSPGKYGDILVIESEIEKMRRASLEFRQTISRKNETGMLVQGRIRLACLNNEGQPTKLPAPLRELQAKSQETV
jgi:acyl-CoA thioester hydrolase